MRMTRAERDAADATKMRLPWACVGEQATEEQLAVWRSVGIIAGKDVTEVTRPWDGQPVRPTESVCLDSQNRLVVVSLLEGTWLAWENVL